VRPLRRATRLAASLIVSVLVAACGSSSINVTAPTTVKCQVSANTSLSSVPATGGSGTITVTTTRDCTWSTSTGAAWIALTSAANGQGNGTVDYRVLANSDRAPRRGTLAVNDKQLAIDQAAAPCAYSVSPTNSAVGAAGGAVTLQVTTSTDCAWTTASGSNWLTVTAGGNGSAAVTITAALNLGPARTGTVTIAGQTVTIAQADGTALCDVSLGSAGGSVGPGGGALAVTVTTAPGCHWSATSSAPWATILNGATGTGSGEVQVSVAANGTRADRQATILIGASRFTINQPAAPCNYAIAPTSTAVPAGGGSAVVMVSAGPACTWTAISETPSWVAVTSGSAGDGDGTVQLSVAANTGAARTGTVTIAGQTYTISQDAAPCSYAIAPSLQSVPASGGPASTMVTPGPA
jgi:hypothetical protein